MKKTAAGKESRMAHAYARLAPVAAALLAAGWLGCVADPITDTRDFAVVDQTAAQDASAVVDAAIIPDARRDFAHPTHDLSGFDSAVPLDSGVPLFLPIHSETWANFCIYYTACGFLNISFSWCLAIMSEIGGPPLFPSSVIQCILGAANNCTAQKQCLAGGSSYECDTPGSFACNGDVLDACLTAPPNVRSVDDCANSKLVCSVNPSGMWGPDGNCGFGTCTGTEWTCNSGIRTECYDDLLWPREDCRVYQNGTCDPAGCRGTGADCTAERCNGNTLVRCGGGKEFSYNCQSRGLECVTPDGGAPRCAHGWACDHSYLGSCAGNVLTYCKYGRVESLNCGLWGMVCNPTAPGTGEPPSGACTPPP